MCLDIRPKQTVCRVAAVNEIITLLCEANFSKIILNFSFTSLGFCSGTKHVVKPKCTTPFLLEGSNNQSNKENIKAIL